MCDKSREIAQNLRCEGNKFYSEKNFSCALLTYNKSLCFSERESENLSLVYANRAALCLETKNYENCLRNIELARAHNYPKENLKILNTREEKCLELLRKESSKKSSHEKWKFFKLSHDSHKNLPHVSNALEMRNNDKFGRHIVTNRDLKVGEILAIEGAFCSVLLSKSNFVDVDENNLYQRCSLCLKNNQFELVPCEMCCYAMFCPECRQMAMEKFHKYECQIMKELLLSGSVHIALRIFFIALSAFKGNVEALKSFIREIDEKDKNFSVFDFDANESDKNYLRFLNSLSRSGKNFSTLVDEKLLESHPELSETYENHKLFIRNFLLRQHQTNDHYFHGIFGPNLQNPGSNNVSDLQQSIGSGWFPFCSLINHSCASNVMRVYVEGKVVLVANRSIRSGSQLFDCYKVSFTKHPKAQRQAILLKEFGFLCDCEACSENYPSPPELKIKDIRLAKSAKKIEDEIKNGKFNQLAKYYNECCKVMNENCGNFPSLEMLILQKCLAFILLLRAQ